ncbi:MAG: MarR family transcriptional regulator [Alphaproteobacteria bacterium]|nr:MarR family transcriptional regulator [Alphaproteobacteria bacterium]
MANETLQLALRRRGATGDQLFSLLRKAHHQLVREVDARALAEFGITSAQGGALRTIAEHGVCSLSIVSDTLGINASAMTGMAARLEAMGFIERRPDPADARAVAVSLTKKGEATLLASDDHFSEIERRLARAAEGETGRVRAFLAAIIEEFGDRRPEKPARAAPRRAARP